MKKNIPPLDLLFYLMETHDNPKHVAALQVFEMPKDASDTYLVDLVDSLRATPAVEPFNYKPLFPRTGMPQWQLDEHMEMEYHLRHSALPRPGTMKQLMTVIQRLHSGMLDRQRPGWICQVIEGLEDNRFAIYCKVHHAYIDGMSSISRIYGSLTTDPESTELTGMWSRQRKSSAKGKDKGKHKDKKSAGLPGRGKVALTQLKAITDLNKQLLRVGMELAKLREHSGHVPFQAPRTKINDPVHSDLRSMGVTSMPLDQLKAIGKAAGGTVNDVVLTISDAALHDYLAKHQDDPNQPLVAMCPMSVRDPGDDSASTQVATLMVELGQPRASLRERLQQVVKSAAGAKADARDMSREGLMNFVLLIGGALEVLQRTGLDRVVPQSYNVLVSNVPGPGTENVYLMGSRLQAIYPISTLTPGNNLNITVLSHGNSLDFGLLAARGTLPDIDYLVERLDFQFAALAKEFGVGTKPKRKAAAKKKTPAKNRAKSKAAATSRAATGGRAKVKAKVKAKAKTKARPKRRASS